MPVTMLIVEDDARQRDALRTLFEESSPDTAVVVAGTLKDALTHDRAGVDGVLLDLNLPDSSGLETLKAILARFAPVPVIVLTGMSDAETGDQAIALGAEDYLEKAIIPPAAIRRLVRHAIRRCSDRTPADLVFPETGNLFCNRHLDGKIMLVEGARIFRSPIHDHKPRHGVPPGFNVSNRTSACAYAP